ncbi:glycoside hydrolase family 79 protein [Auriscalpium vulgare]|uniref:Glycoside hydrolase family 79 protein n=1 Tax=Auriscalpium vulgare TaxID=40419 RepID=A0ACB8S8R8_9AGAM|nr:glycoside hydrolase family 79 protein [Auriscalpium vulgare]
MRPGSLLPLAFCVGLARAQYTVYQPLNQQIIFGGNPDSTPTAAGPAATYTGAAAYDPTVLVAPSPPNPGIPTQFGVQLYSGGMTNLSRPQSGAFFGFSIEMSVSTHVLGKNSSLINVPFLNLMANVKERAGWVQVRVGGNTQENAELVAAGTLPNNSILAKDYSSTFTATGSHPLAYTSDLLYMMANISDFTNTHWFLGVPFFNTTPFALEIVEQAQTIIGDRMLGFQAGNEPDLYAVPPRTNRPVGYAPADYTGEVGLLVQQTNNDALITQRQNLFLVPSISATVWTPEQVWDTGIVESYGSSLYGLSVERYPNNNCAAVYGSGTPVDVQATFPSYLNHGAATGLIQSYINSSNFAMENNKPMIMFETNTASCSGFPGISDSFGAALWSLDWAFTMAFYNFSTALFHVGGQNAYYNPFTPPPTNQSTFREWTIGPVYYAALVMAEALGPSNASQVVDLGMNDGNTFTPGYAIYEGGSPTKLVLFNFVTDNSTASDYTASISIGGGQTGQPAANPSQVKVKYLRAESVSQKGNFTWAGQTMGNNFESDGRLKGDVDVQTVTCDGNNVCAVKVPAPSVALVFLTDDSYNAVTPSNTITFPTTVQTRTVNTIYIDPSAIETSNGHWGMEDHVGATSFGHKSAATLRRSMPGVALLIALAAGAFVAGRALVAA